MSFAHPRVSVGLGLAESSKSSLEEYVPPQVQQVSEIVESGICAGFQLATSAGPLCMEPMWGVAFEVDAKLLWPIKAQDDSPPQLALGEDVYGPFFGQVKHNHIVHLVRIRLEASSLQVLA